MTKLRDNEVDSTSRSILQRVTTALNNLADSHQKLKQTESRPGWTKFPAAQCPSPGPLQHRYNGEPLPLVT
jgi:hypothetical protein